MKTQGNLGMHGTHGFRVGRCFKPSSNRRRAAKG
jgi:hypothetical protein